MLKPLAFVGKILVFLASMAFITGLSLFIVGGYCMTYPVTRMSPRSARTRALVDLFVSLMALGNAYGLGDKLTQGADDADAQ
jgi:hypothetical protein